MREALLRFGDTAKFRGIGKPFAVTRDQSYRVLWHHKLPRTGPQGRNWIGERDRACSSGEDRCPIDHARPLLLAAPGREPTDSATVCEHGPADRLAAVARVVGERQTGAGFGGERGRGGERVRGTGRRRVSFEFWDCAERQYWPFPWLVQAHSSENSTGD